MNKEKNNNNVLKGVLLDSNYISAADMKKAEEYTKKNKISLEEYLLREEIIDKNILGQAIAESFDIPYANLNSKKPSQEQILKIPEGIARKYRAVLFSINPKEAVVATDKPKQSGIISALKKALKTKKISIAYSLSEDIETSFINYRKSLKTRFSGIIKKRERVAPEIINEIIKDAVSYNSSDIHFEPQGDELVIRFRVDGVLQEAGRISKENYENILNRIKVQANLRIDEHSVAQDGAIRFVDKDLKVDMRISIVPTIEGEKIVIRLLAQYVKGFSMSDMGLSSHDQKLLDEAIKRPFGMILVTGPTGSGKTTTLYSILKSLNNPDINITTIEDPVEYKIKGVNQIQVNKQTNLTFAKGLRSIVRQDPDIILVGEIRDNETSEIAINAALTGHLLLSTFHANDAASAIPRLLDMGSEPFLLASTLEIIVAQRLARKICDSCRYSKAISKEEIEKTLPGSKKYFDKDKINLYQGKGCPVCNNTGYSGRTAIFEVIEITKEIEELVLKNPTAKEIWDLAKSQGAHSLFEDGIEKIKNGITTIEEVRRVAGSNY